MSEKNEWKLVPVVPTDEMEAAAEDDYEQTGATFPRWKSAYAAMLAAAPAPSAPGDAQDERQAFEAWMASRNLGFLRDGDSYSLTYARRAWDAWQARARIDAPAAGDALDLPELNADLIDILGRPNFMCIRIAQLLRLCGVKIATKAEAEQATVIHYLLGFYLKHGSQWAEKADEDLKQRRDAALAAQVPHKGGAA